MLCKLLIQDTTGSWDLKTYGTLWKVKNDIIKNKMYQIVGF